MATRLNKSAILLTGGMTDEQELVLQSIANAGAFTAQQSTVIDTKTAVDDVGSTASQTLTQVTSNTSQLATATSAIQGINTTLANNAITTAPTKGSVVVATAGFQFDTSKYSPVGYPVLPTAVGSQYCAGISVPSAFSTLAAYDTAFVALTGSNSYYLINVTPSGVLPACVSASTGTTITSFARCPYLGASYGNVFNAVASRAGGGVYVIGKPSTASNTIPQNGAVVYGSEATGLWTIKPVGPTLYLGIVDSVIDSSGVEHLIYVGGVGLSSYPVSSAYTQANIMAAGNKVVRYNTATGVSTVLADLPLGIVGMLYRATGGTQGNPLTIYAVSQKANAFYSSSQSTYNNGQNLVMRIVFNADYSSYTVSYMLSTSTTFRRIIAIEPSTAAGKCYVYAHSATTGCIDIFLVDFTAMGGWESPSALAVAPPVIAGSINVNTHAGGVYSLTHVAGHARAGYTPLCAPWATSGQSTSDPNYVQNVVIPVDLYNHLVGAYRVGLTIIQLPTNLVSIPHAVDANGNVQTYRLLIKN